MARTLENKTLPTQASVEDFIEGVANRGRREDARTLLGMMRRVTGLEPVMWGPSIIGFGESFYILTDGARGRVPALAFSPRSNRMVLYLPLSQPEIQERLSRLGPHSIGVTCLYLKRLADVDPGVLEEILRASYTPGADPQHLPRHGSSLR